MTTLALGHYARFYDDKDALVWAFQNFYLGTTVNHGGLTYSFVPFGFSGLSASKDGELAPATLVFPNNEISRAYLTEALRGRSLSEELIWRRPYVGEVDVNVLDPSNNSVVTTLFTYVGQATAGGWDDTSLRMQLSSVLDAVSGDIPTRTLHRNLVGALPLSANVRLR